jgi:hypothetical protein
MGMLKVAEMDCFWHVGDECMICGGSGRVKVTWSEPTLQAQRMYDEDIARWRGVEGLYKAHMRRRFWDRGVQIW